MTNQIEGIVDHIRSVLATGDALRVYEIWPPGSPGCVDGSVSLVLIGPSGPDWKKSDWGEVQATVGAALPALAAHDELYRRVGDLGG